MPTTQAALQQYHPDHDEQHRPVPADITENRYAQVIKQEQHSQADEQGSADGGIHFHVAKPKPFRRPLAKLLSFGGLI